MVLGFRSTDVQIPRSSVPPTPWIIPDWRRLQGIHPKSSQIGVGFAHMGTDWREVAKVLGLFGLMANGKELKADLAIC